ncbi:MAG: hypothetical protein LBI86_10435, partial [Treponema sp.]|nr:hypothetical protein [Treponema sp.]
LCNTAVLFGDKNTITGAAVKHTCTMMKIDKIVNYTAELSLNRACSKNQPGFGTSSYHKELAGFF